MIGIGAGIAPPTKTRDVRPVFPSSGQGPYQGQVLVEAIIGPDGKIASTRIVRGLSPDLDAAALTAVRQWEYTPTVFDGVAISVPVTVVVTFTG